MYTCSTLRSILEVFQLVPYKGLSCMSGSDCTIKDNHSGQENGNTSRLTRINRCLEDVP